MTKTFVPRLVTKLPSSEEGSLKVIAGVETVVMATAELFSGCSSWAERTTSTRLVNVPSAFGTTVTSIRTLDPEAIVPMSQTTTPLFMLQLPCELVTEMKSTLGGRMFVANTDEETCGPEFVTSTW